MVYQPHAQALTRSLNLIFLPLKPSTCSRRVVEPAETQVQADIYFSIDFD
jgi:hypothetical protein